MARGTRVTKTKTLEQRLWDAADALRGNQEPSEYKHVVLGLVFLKYISDRFETRRREIDHSLADPESSEYIPNKERRQAFLEDRDEYSSHNVFWVPAKARWSYVQDRAKLPEIGQVIDGAMDLIEKENRSITGVLPRNYGREGLDKGRLGQLVDLIGSIGFTETDDHGSDDVLGRVYEYFLGQFAGKETGKDAGAFYTPRPVVRLLVSMLEPYRGRVYDPCCGSGGMFVQSAEFVKAHGGQRTDISIYGQEFTDTTWKLARMNLALRGIEADLGDQSADSFTRDLQPDLRADFVLANPPFNVSTWWDDKLANDPRWKFGTPPESNANFAWAEHIVHHLSPRGRAGFVLANMSLASDASDELAIRKGLLDANLVDCIVTMPDKLFTNTPIAVSLWFLDKTRDKRNADEVLFIDAGKAGYATSRTSNSIGEEASDELAAIYHQWRESGQVPDDQGRLRIASVPLDEIRRDKFVLLPAAYMETSREDSDSDLSLAEALQGPSLLSGLAVLSRLDGVAAELSEEVEKLAAGLDAGDVEFVSVALSELLEPSSERLGDGNRPEPEILTCTEGAGLVLQRERFAKRVATENTAKYKLVRKGDIVYNPYLLWKGSIDQCWIVGEGITSPAYEVFQVREGYHRAIVGRLLTSAEMIRRYDGISFGTVERRRRAAPASFLNLQVDYPTGPLIESLSSLLERLRLFQSMGRDLERGLRDSVSDLYGGLMLLRGEAEKP
jgi:type I restriction enzyme M protein